MPGQKCRFLGPNLKLWAGAQESVLMNPPGDSYTQSSLRTLCSGETQNTKARCSNADRYMPMTGNSKAYVVAYLFKARSKPMVANFVYEVALSKSAAQASFIFSRRHYFLLVLFGEFHLPGQGSTQRHESEQSGGHGITLKVYLPHHTLGESKERVPAAAGEVSFSVVVL